MRHDDWLGIGLAILGATGLALSSAPRRDTDTVCAVVAGAPVAHAADVRGGEGHGRCTAAGDPLQETP